MKSEQTKATRIITHSCGAILKAAPRKRPYSPYIRIRGEAMGNSPTLWWFYTLDGVHVYQCPKCRETLSSKDIMVARVLF
jgi:hypothetical protein